jgi:hypothetical protein
VQRLRAEISSDLRAFESRVEELAGLDLSTDPASPAVLAQAAVALHHGYGAVEAALARVARFLEGSLPTGGGWHQELLASMALDIPEVRPAVLRRGTADALRILLGFRHFFRHGYAIEWDRPRLAELRRTALALRPEVVEDFRRLDELLARLADED